MTLYPSILLHGDPVGRGHGAHNQQTMSGRMLRPTGREPVELKELA